MSKLIALLILREPRLGFCDLAVTTMREALEFPQGQTSPPLPNNDDFGPLVCFLPAAAALSTSLGRECITATWNLSMERCIAGLVKEAGFEGANSGSVEKGDSCGRRDSPRSVTMIYALMSNVED